jgi:hypothetical protein
MITKTATISRRRPAGNPIPESASRMGRAGRTRPSCGEELAGGVGVCPDLFRAVGLVGDGQSVLRYVGKSSN